MDSLIKAAARALASAPAIACLWARRRSATTSLPSAFVEIA